MAIVLEDGYNHVLFSFEEFRGGSEVMGAAEFAFERGFNDLFGLACLRPDYQIAVCRFPIDGIGNAAIVEAVEMDI